MKERIAKVLAHAGVASRRKSEELINRGLVSVNDKKLDTPATLVDVNKDVIKVRGKEIGTRKLRYIILNKPRNVLSTAHDSRGRKTVLDLVRIRGERLYPVGRLDKDTIGLILITNDGELTNRLTHPRYEIPRVYEVEVKGVPNEATIKKIRHGVILEDGKTAPCECKPIRRTRTTTLFRMILKEGKKREIRRMWAAVDHPAYSINRTAFGPIKLGNLSFGKSRDLTYGEVYRLKKAVRL